MTLEQKFILEFAGGRWLVTETATQQSASFIDQDTAEGALQLVNEVPEKWVLFLLEPRSDFEPKEAA